MTRAERIERALRGIEERLSGIRYDPLLLDIREAARLALAPEPEARPVTVESLYASYREARASVALDRDQTHYVGDSCPGGHGEDAPPRCTVCGYDEESHKFVCACDKFTPPPDAGRCER